MGVLGPPGQLQQRRERVRALNRRGPRDGAKRRPGAPQRPGPCSCSNQRREECAIHRPSTAAALRRGRIRSSAPEASLLALRRGGCDFFCGTGDPPVFSPQESWAGSPCHVKSHTLRGVALKAKLWKRSRGFGFSSPCPNPVPTHSGQYRRPRASRYTSHSVVTSHTNLPNFLPTCRPGPFARACCLEKRTPWKQRRHATGTQRPEACSTCDVARATRPRLCCEENELWTSRPCHGDPGSVW